MKVGDFMKVIPLRYDHLELSQSEKKLIEVLEASYIEDSNSYFLLKTTPAGISNLHVFISNEGVVFIEPNSLKDLKLLSLVRGGMEASIKENIKKLYTRLTTHKQLRVKGKDNEYLKFPFTYKILLTEIRAKDAISSNLSKADKEFLKNHCIFKDSKPTEDNLLFKLAKGFGQTNDLLEAMYSNVDHPYWKNWNGFSNEDVNNILQMISPEYTIPVPKEDEKENQPTYDITNTDHEELYTVNESDFNVQVHRLDDEQIQIINSIRRGNQLILACAGSGKSVILISKAFKAASIHNDKRFLITCFNRNLSNFYNWKIALAGYRDRNVTSLTFHKLIQELLDEANIRFSYTEYDENFEKAKKALAEGKIKRRYYGIFLDEIQVFKSEWYEFCYNLLESHEKDNYFFTICGDISQNINRNIKKGKAPWQAPSDSYLPKYTGRSLRIEKNYRNSIEINTMMESYINVSKKYIKDFDILLENEEESFLLGKAFRESCEPNIIITDRSNCVDEIVKEIKHLNEVKRVPLNRIAVIFPYRQYKPLRYFLMSWLENKLNENFIDYFPLISGSDGSLPAHYGNNTGVALTTIEASLGLDFDAVILTGLLPMGTYHRSKYINNMLNRSSDNEDIEQDFIENVNKIYTACTRARDYLTIVLEEDENRSLYSKMILESVNGGLSYEQGL